MPTSEESAPQDAGCQRLCGPHRQRPGQVLHSLPNVVAYLLKRLALAALLVFAVASGSLVLSRLAPGDYATEALGFEAGPEAVAATRTRYGLDRPFASQYADWLSGAVRFDFGRSLAYDRPVRDLIAERAWNTALLALIALVLATAIGVPLGVISGTYPRGLLTGAVRAGSTLLLSLPPLLTSLLLVFIAARTGWLPVGGMVSVGADAGGFLDRLRHLVIPAWIERIQSQAITEAAGQPFVLAMLARGLSRPRAIWRHAFKVSLRPVASVYGIVVGTVLSGSFAVEIVTAWPGLGRLTLDALRARDVFLVAGCAATGALLLAVGTLVADVVLAAVDPRTSEGAE
jgi:peptide/nickel transport system permease protein